MASIFSKIIQREIPSDIVFENEKIIVIKDLYPQMKIHFLIIPKEEIESINDLQESHKNLLFEMFETAQNLAKEYALP